MKEIENNLKQMFQNYFNEDVILTEKLPESGSPRKYYRIKSKNNTAIGAFNTDLKENTAFIKFSENFRNNGLNVPEIYAQDLKQNIYLQEDLGDETLYDRSENLRKGKTSFPEELIEIYKNIIEKLINFQLNAGKNLDYTYAYPREKFDRQSMQWDLNYFKYFFIKLANIPFNEQYLENDFNKLINYLLDTETEYFLFRDFKAKNIMLKGEDIYFIDYQGGRKGALHYDIATLLYGSKADIPENIREILKIHYLKTLQEKTGREYANFNELFTGYALIRIMQAMGAYGFRGFFEKKTYFLESIPFAMKNIKTILSEHKLPVEIPELKRILEEISVSEKLLQISENHTKLTVTVRSFSYMRGIPYNKTGNGGGFVFDCRFLDNPGRIEKYKLLNGKDKEVIDFLENRNEVFEFLKNTQSIINHAIKKYISRKFTNITIDFGCTGGQHRSVYCAEKTVEYLKENFDIIIKTEHTEGF